MKIYDMELGGEKRPLEGKVKPGTNTASISLLQEIHSWPKIDINDPKQVEQRSHDYLDLMREYDSKPLVNTYAHCLGIDRRRLYELVNNIPVSGKISCDKIDQNSLAIIQEYYHMLAEGWEFAFANGKFNHPATGIFLGKNHFGYVDQQDVIVAPKNPLGVAEDREKIEQRYLETVVSE